MNQQPSLEEVTLISYCNSECPLVRFKQYSNAKVPAWAVDIRAEIPDASEKYLLDEFNKELNASIKPLTKTCMVDNQTFKDAVTSHQIRGIGNLSSNPGSPYYNSKETRIAYYKFVGDIE